MVKRFRHVSVSTNYGAFRLYRPARFLFILRPRGRSIGPMPINEQSVSPSTKLFLLLFFVVKRIRCSFSFSSSTSIPSEILSPRTFSNGRYALSKLHLRNFLESISIRTKFMFERGFENYVRVSGRVDSNYFIGRSVRFGNVFLLISIPSVCSFTRRGRQGPRERAQVLRHFLKIRRVRSVD